MKKFLSLVLAMIMVMSLVTVGAGATFTDADEIQYVEAVELMSSLGILEGYEGAFSPKGNLSRAAAAKIIAYISLGKTAADKLTYTKVIFPDVELTSSTAPYIAWCYDQGIINGYTNGNFGRKDDVSGYAFLKMVLGAVGVYGKYTGTGWQNVVLTKAAAEGLLEGIDQDTVDLFSKPISREVASQIAFNAMSYDRDVKEGYLVDGILFTNEQGTALLNASNYIALMKLDVAPRYVAAVEGTLLDKVHGLEEAVVGFVTKNSANTDTDKTTVLVGDEEMVFGVNTGLDVLGSYVKFYYKDVTNATKKEENGLTYVSGVELGKEITISGTATAAELKAALLAAGFEEDLDAITVSTLKADGTVDPTTVTTGIELGKTTGKDVTGAANHSVTLIVTEEKVDDEIVYEIVAAKHQLDKKLDKVKEITTTADAAYITFTTAGKKANGVKDKTTLKVADVVNEYEGIAKNDIVVITEIGDIVNVEKATTVVGKVTKVDGATDPTLTVNGVVYPQKGTGTAGMTKVTSFDFTTEYTLYLDGQGNYIMAKANTATYTAPIVLVLSSETKSTLVDGAIEEVTVVTYVKKDGTVATVQAAMPENGQGLYKLDKETAEDAEYEYKFSNLSAADKKKATTGDKTIDADVDKKTSGFEGAQEGKTYYYSDSVKFISVYDDDESAKYEWKTNVLNGVQTVNNKTTYFMVTTSTTSNNWTVDVVFVMDKLEAAGETLDDVVYAVDGDAYVVTQVPYTNAKGETKSGYVHTVYMNGEKTTITTTSSDKLEGFLTLEVKGEAYEATPITENGGTKVKLYDNVAITNVYKSLISIDGETDVNAADAEVFDLRELEDDEDPITAASKLKAGMTVSLVIDNTGDEPAVVTIFLTAAPEA